MTVGNATATRIGLDVEDLRTAIDRAEGAPRAQTVAAAWAAANVAAAITRQPFLLFRDELGAEPSAQTASVFTEILRLKGSRS